MTRTMPLPKNAPAVVAVVLNWNGFADTQKCVASLQQIDYANFEIVIVDNGSTDGSAEKLRQAFPHLKIIRLQKNLGYAAGNNAGIKFALAQGAAYILVINNDVVAEKDFLSPMVELAERMPEIGVVTCKVCYLSNPKQIYAAGGTFSRWLCTGINDLQWQFDDPERNIKDREREISFAPGCLMLIRSVVFERAGLLDERFFLYVEDLEFSRRVGNHFRMIYTPRGKVYHKSGAGTSWASYTPTYLYYHTRNRLWVFRNDALLYRAYVFLFSLMNALAKTLVLWQRKPADSRQRIRALWRGFRDGVSQSQSSS